jgi:hypothetical protein
MNFFQISQEELFNYAANNQKVSATSEQDVTYAVIDFCEARRHKTKVVLYLGANPTTSEFTTTQAL